MSLLSSLMAATALDLPHCSEAMRQRLSPGLTVYQYSPASSREVVDALAMSLLVGATTTGLFTTGACAGAAADPVALVGIMYFRPTMILSGLSLSEGFAAT